MPPHQSKAKPSQHGSIARARPAAVSLLDAVNPESSSLGQVPDFRRPRGSRPILSQAPANEFRTTMSGSLPELEVAGERDLFREFGLD